MNAPATTAASFKLPLGLVAAVLVMAGLAVHVFGARRWRGV